MDDTTKSLGGSATAVLVAALVAVSASYGGVDRAGLPVAVWCLLVAFAINWAGFVHSLALRTERYYDITGTATYLAVVLTALVLVGRYDPLSLLLVSLVAVWTLRLGPFLFRRISRAGSDSRFERILTRPAQLFMTWTLQGLWVSLTLAAAIAALTVAERPDAGHWWIPGLAIWFVGFTIEVVADVQKSAFKDDPANEGAFIRSGLWAWSRHPNYFGEITLWVGVAVIAFPALSGWAHLTLVSPLFVYVLLRYISGVPLLERKAQKRWGDDPVWRAYQRNTPMLVPLPPHTAASRSAGSGSDR